jgi:hypothetical protein
VSSKRPWIHFGTKKHDRAKWCRSCNDCIYFDIAAMGYRRMIVRPRESRVLTMALQLDRGVLNRSGRAWNTRWPTINCVIDHGDEYKAMEWVLLFKL